MARQRSAPWWVVLCRWIWKIAAGIGTLILVPLAQNTLATLFTGSQKAVDENSLFGWMEKYWQITLIIALPLLFIAIVAFILSRWPTKQEQEEPLVIEQKKPPIPQIPPQPQLPPADSLKRLPPRNSLFTGRETLLAELEQALRQPLPIALSQPQAISGLGGIGKTQTALEYAYRHWHDYETILWLAAETRDTLLASCTEIARDLRLPEVEESDLSRVLVALKRWLSERQRWLLIFDNIEDLKLIAEVAPAVHSQDVLLTTRLHNTTPIAQTYEIKKFEPEEGILFLLRRVSRQPQKVALAKADPDDLKAANELYKLVDGLPLALQQAGAYIAQNNSSLQKYIELYKEDRTKLLQQESTLTPDHESVTVTFTLAWRQIEQRNETAGKILCLCAFLAPDQIPETMLLQELDSPQPQQEKSLPLISRLFRHTPPQEGALDAEQKEQAVGLLSRYSLVERSKGVLSLHRLVQEVVQESLSSAEQEEWKERAIQAVNRQFPSGEYGTWTTCEELLPHALVCARWIETQKKSSLQAASLLNVMGYYLHERAQYAEAEPLYERALAIYEQELGAGHPDTAMSLNNLAELYRSQGRYGEAEPLYERALAICEQELGVGHPDTAMSLNNLALLYRSQGRDQEAEPLYERALQIREQELGAEHPDTANSLNNLAGLYWSQGRDREAEPLYERTLMICEQELGAEHPYTANSLNNLAMLYRSQGRDREAEPLYERALAIFEQALGREHPNTQVARENYAAFLRDLGRDEEARKLEKGS